MAMWGIDPAEKASLAVSLFISVLGRTLFLVLGFGILMESVYRWMEETSPYAWRMCPLVMSHKGVSEKPVQRSSQIE